jgi:hypothetical protein
MLMRKVISIAALLALMLFGTIVGARAQASEWQCGPLFVYIEEQRIYAFHNRTKDNATDNPIIFEYSAQHSPFSIKNHALYHRDKPCAEYKKARP